MATISCKMCGANLPLTEGASVVECEFCGVRQTVPTADNEKKMALFGRANRLRFACEFDKAAGVYESIVAEFPTEAEAYWGLVLCKYGIEYVDDPATGKKIPTCHRSSFDSVMDDENFEQAQENADAIARSVYREEAKQIEELRKGIIEISGKEAPYDIFICYKETAADGGRTVDSVLAQDVYDALTEKGYRVFFSRITLEDKLGQEYEPYIFAALSTAKVMLAFGTSYENYNAVWVKNEWGRFLQLIAKGEKKVLIPCYKDIDAYDMPKEFARLQAQDMGKIGAVQDLLRGIEKLIPKNVAKEGSAAQPAAPQSATTRSLLQRVNLYLEDGEWDNAREYCNRVLDIEPDNATAYTGLLLADLRVRRLADLGKGTTDFAENKNYQKAVRYASPESKKALEGLLETARQNKREKERIAEEKRKEQERVLEEKRKETKKSAQMAKLIACEIYSLGLKTDGTVMEAELDHNLFIDNKYDVSEWRDIVEIGCFHYCAVGLRADGTVAIGKNKMTDIDISVSDWHDIVAIAGVSHIIGLKKDGTVVATGYNSENRCAVSGWRDIVAIACGFSHTVGLKKDGTVVATGENDKKQCNVSDWHDVVAIVCDDDRTVGLKKDGTVVATGENDKKQCNVSDWHDVVAIACGEKCTVGLKADGTVVATGENDKKQCNVSDWHDVVAIACGYSHTAGLKKDGTVVTTDESDQSEVSSWRDVIAIACGPAVTIGLKKDGTVVTTAEGKKTQSDISSWKLFNNIDNLEEERKVEMEKRRKADRKAQGVCQYCGGTFKGMFGKKCSLCGKPKDY